MPQDFLASVSGGPTEAVAARPVGPADPSPKAAPTDLEAFLALFAPVETTQDRAAGTAVVTVTAEEVPGAPDDPLAALLAAFLPGSAEDAAIAPLPDWLRAALLGSAARPAPTDTEGAGTGGVGLSIEPGAIAVTGTADAAAGSGGDGGEVEGIGRVGRAGVPSAADLPGRGLSGGGTSAEGPPDSRAGGPLLVGSDEAIGSGPEGAPDGGPPDQMANGAGTVEAGETPVATSPSGTVATSTTASLSPAGPVEGGRARARQSDPAERRSGQTGVSTARAADGPQAFRTLTEVPSGRASDRTAPAAPAAPTGAAVESVAEPTKAPALPDLRTAAPAPDGMEHPAARAAAPTAAPTAAGAAVESLQPTVEPQRPSIAPAPIALSQLRDAMTERVRVMAEEAGDDSVRLRSATGTAEVELAPAELGRLRLQLSTTERGLHLTVLVDRPESVDAVRRHLDGLHRSLMAEGLTLDSFDIGTEARGQEQAAGQGRPRQNAAVSPPLHVPDADAPLPGTPPPATGRTATGRLDIRI